MSANKTAAMIKTRHDAPVRPTRKSGYKWIANTAAPTLKTNENSADNTS